MKFKQIPVELLVTALVIGGFSLFGAIKAYGAYKEKIGGLENRRDQLISQVTALNDSLDFFREADSISMAEVAASRIREDSATTVAAALRQQRRGLRSTILTLREAVTDAPDTTALVTSLQALVIQQDSSIQILVAENNSCSIIVTECQKQRALIETSRDQWIEVAEAFESQRDSALTLSDDFRSIGRLRRFGFSVTGGLGSVYDPSTKKFYTGPGVLIGISYSF